MYLHIATDLSILLLQLLLHGWRQLLLKLLLRPNGRCQRIQLLLLNRRDLGVWYHSSRLLSLGLLLLLLSLGLLLLLLLRLHLLLLWRRLTSCIPLLLRGLKLLLELSQLQLLQERIGIIHIKLLRLLLLLLHLLRHGLSNCLLRLLPSDRLLIRILRLLLLHGSLQVLLQHGHGIHGLGLLLLPCLFLLRLLLLLSLRLGLLVLLQHGQGLLRNKLSNLIRHGGLLAHALLLLLRRLRSLLLWSLRLLHSKRWRLLLLDLSIQRRRLLLLQHLLQRRKLLLRQVDSLRLRRRILVGLWRHRHTARQRRGLGIAIHSIAPTAAASNILQKRQFRHVAGVSGIGIELRHFGQRSSVLLLLGLAREFVATTLLVFVPRENAA